MTSVLFFARKGLLPEQINSSCTNFGGEPNSGTIYSSALTPEAA
jgi:hypothetical protein